MMPRLRTVLMCVCAGLAAIVGVSAIAQGVSLPEAPGRQQIMDSCTRCHGVDVIVAQPRSPDQWSEVVSIMIGQGAVLNDEEYERVVTYLSANLAPAKAAPDQTQ